MAGTTSTGLYRYTLPSGQEVQYGDPVINRGALSGATYIGRQGDTPGNQTPDPLSAYYATNGADNNPANSPVRRYTAGDFGLDTNPDGTPKLAFTEADAQAIRDNTNAEMTARVSAIDNVYAGLIAAEQKQGDYRSGQTRALVARGGLSGSPRGASEQYKTTQYNDQLMQELQAKKSAEIQAVYDNIDSKAQDRIAAEQARIQGDANAYLDYLSKSRDSAREDVKTLASAGIKLDQLDQQDIQNLMTDGGFDSRALFDSFYNANLPKAVQVKYSFNVLKDGTLLRTGDDGSSQVITDIKLPKQSDPQFIQTQNGEVLFVDKNDPFNADGSPKYHDLGNYAKSNTASGGSSSYQASITNRTLDAVDTAIGNINDYNTGTLGKIQAGVPGSDAYNLQEQLQQIKANIAFNELTQMRAASATGGALGQVSDTEEALLSSVLGSLDIGQSKTQLLSNLNKIKESLKRWQDANGGAGSGGAGGTSGFIVTSPDGTDTRSFDSLDESQQQTLKDAGYTITPQ